MLLKREFTEIFSKIPSFKCLRPLCILSLTTLLFGCALFPSEKALSTTATSWSQRQKDVAHIKHWKINGAIGVKTNEKSWSASYIWRQLNHRVYQIRIIAPLGAGQYRLSANADRAVLITGKNKRFTGATTQALLKKHTGWQLPVDDLYYWVRGLPVPNTPKQLRLNANHRLSELRQHGWHIRFLRYKQIGSIALPSKLFLQGPGIHIRLVIKQWKIM